MNAAGGTDHGMGRAAFVTGGAVAGGAWPTGRASPPNRLFEDDPAALFRAPPDGSAVAPAGFCAPAKRL